MAELTIDFNAENEQIVLGALLKSKAERGRTLAKLRPEWFNVPAHRAVIEALQELRRQGADYAADSVVQVAGSAEVTLKWLRKLEDLYEALPPENMAVHVAMLRRDAAKFQAVGPFEQLYDHLDNPEATLEEVEAATLAILRCVREGKVDDGQAREGPGVMDEWLRDIEDMRAKRTANFVPLGFTGLDKHLYEGLRPGQIVVVAGRPGMGKSTFCSNLILRQAREGRRVLSVPVEAGQWSVVEQMACAKSKVKAERVVKTPDELTTEEMVMLEHAGRSLIDRGNIVFDDQIGNLDELELKVEDRDFDVVVLDLFEYLMTGRFDAADVTRDLRRLKRIATRRKFAAVVVHQIRRIQRKKDLRPQLHELKNSGGYEEVADLVLLLHRPKYYNKDAESEDIMEIKIAKQRRGAQNLTVGFEFQPEICRVGKDTGDFDQ